MAITKGDLLKGALSGSDQAANQAISADYQARNAAQKDERDAALRQLLQGQQQQFEQAQQGRAHDYDLDKMKAQKAQDDASLQERVGQIQELQKQAGNTGHWSLGDKTASFTPIDPLDKAMKRESLAASAEDRRARIEGREANSLQNFAQSAGAKNFAQKNQVLQKALDAYALGTPEGNRTAEMELANGMAQGALTNQEYGAMTASHSLGNRMQAKMKDASALAHMIPGVGDGLSKWLSGKAATMQTMTPDELAQKQDVIRQSMRENKAASDRLNAELGQRKAQLAPSMSRHNPQGLQNVIDTMGVRIPDGTAVTASHAAQAGGKVRVSNGKETLEIDAADLPHASADGYKQVQ